MTLKKGVLDPQGKAVGHALESMGFKGVRDVRQGKYIEIDLAEATKAAAQEKVEAICRKLLANMVMEDYEIEIEE